MLEHGKPIMLPTKTLVEISIKMHFAVPIRVLVVNEIENTEIIIDPEENLNGIKPQLLIHLKEKITRRTKTQKS